MTEETELRHMLTIVDARLLVMLEPAAGAAAADGREVALYKAIRRLLQRLIDRDAKPAAPLS